MHALQASTPTRRGHAVAACGLLRGSERANVPPTLRRAVGAAGLLGVLGASLLLAAGAAGAPSAYVPARSGGWPGWLAGPLSGLGLGLPGERFQTLMLVMCGGYALALAASHALSARTLWA